MVEDVPCRSTSKFSNHSIECGTRESRMPPAQSASWCVLLTCNSSCLTRADTCTSLRQHGRLFLFTGKLNTRQVCKALPHCFCKRNHSSCCCWSVAHLLLVNFFIILALAGMTLPCLPMKENPTALRHFLVVLDHTALAVRSPFAGL